MQKRFLPSTTYLLIPVLPPRVIPLPPSNPLSPLAHPSPFPLPRHPPTPPFSPLFPSSPLGARSHGAGGGASNAPCVSHAMELAVEHLTPPASPAPLALDFANASAADAFQAEAAALDLLLGTPPPSVLLGPSTSLQTSVVGPIASVMQVPMLAYAATDPLLNANAQLPYFVRVHYDDYAQMAVVADLVGFYNWTQVVALFESTDSAWNGFQSLTRLLQQRGTARVVASWQFDSAVSAETDVMAAFLQVRAVEASVFVLHLHSPTTIRIVLKTAAQLGLFTAGYVWIATAGVMSVLSTDRALSPILVGCEGMLGTLPFDVPTARLADVQQAIKARANTALATLQSPDEALRQAISAYDAVHLAAYAAVALSRAPPPPPAPSPPPGAAPSPPPSPVAGTNPSFQQLEVHKGYFQQLQVRAGASWVKGVVRAYDSTQKSFRRGCIAGLHPQEQHDRTPGRGVIHDRGRPTGAVLLPLSRLTNNPSLPSLPFPNPTPTRVSFTTGGDLQEQFFRPFLSSIQMVDRLEARGLTTRAAAAKAVGVSAAAAAASQGVVADADASLRAVIWPGGITEVPLGAFPKSSAPLQIAVPNKKVHHEFVFVGESSNGTSSSNDKFSGFCIDVFKSAVALLPYTLSYQFVAYGDGQTPPSYDAMLSAVANKTYDAAVGDITITSDRALLVDFTQPFERAAPNTWAFLAPFTPLPLTTPSPPRILQSSGLSFVVPVQRAAPNTWAFLAPFTPLPLTTPSSLSLEASRFSILSSPSLTPPVSPPPTHPPHSPTHTAPPPLILQSSGLSFVVPVQRAAPNTWAFLAPFTPGMWVLLYVSFFYTALVVWFLEHLQNEDFGGKLHQQLATSVWFSFATMTFSHEEQVRTTLGRTVVIVWLFVVFVISSAYTASLSSVLTVSQSEPTVSDFTALQQGNQTVGYRAGSFTAAYMQGVGINEVSCCCLPLSPSPLCLDTLMLLAVPVHLRSRPIISLPFSPSFPIPLSFCHPSPALPSHLPPSQSRLVAIDPEGDWEAVVQEQQVAVVVDEEPYLDIFLSDHCYYTKPPHAFATFNFGFAFQRGSSLTADLSLAIETLAQNGQLQSLHDLWLRGKGTCSSGLELESMRLGPDSFWGLFLLYLLSAMGTCLLYAALLVYRGLKAFRLAQQQAAAERAAAAEQEGQEGEAPYAVGVTPVRAPVSKPRRLKSRVRHYKSAYTAGVEWSMQRNIGVSSSTLHGSDSNPSMHYDVSHITYSSTTPTGDGLATDPAAADGAAAAAAAGAGGGDSDGSDDGRGEREAGEKGSAGLGDSLDEQLRELRQSQFTRSGSTL
ncbi:unnamed protein product [Closterium sp. NIES-65]|nr:unnamed protein product [Closterium sp. NIES-65]